MKKKMDMTYQTVLVIGAGVAGLAAAKELKNAGYQVTLIEARNYVGGRVKTDHSLGIPFPCGAAYVHGTVNPIFDYLQQHQANLYNYTSLSPAIIFDNHQQQYLPEELLKTKSHFENILNEAKQFSFSKKNDISLLDSIKYVLKNKNEAQKFSWELLYLSMFTGIEASHLSAKNWDQMGEFDGDYFLIDSYEPFINDLSQNQNIFLNTIVNSIHYGDEQILLETNNGNFTADIVIITVPIGVLKNKKIKFMPELPPAKQHAVESLNMSQLNKIGLLFQEQFWPKEIIKIGYDADPNSAITFFQNCAYFYKHPVLLGAVSGEAAVKLETEGKQAFIKRTMITLRKLFGQAVPEPIAVITTNWINDPFSYGSYSYIPVGTTGGAFDVIAEPVGNKLFFAGEATYRSCHSTVQGAYLSGIREAKRIISIYNAKDTRPYAP